MRNPFFSSRNQRESLNDALLRSSHRFALQVYLRRGCGSSRRNEGASRRIRRLKNVSAAEMAVINGFVSSHPSSRWGQPIKRRAGRNELTPFLPLQSQDALHQAGDSQLNRSNFWDAPTDGQTPITTG